MERAAGSFLSLGTTFISSIDLQQGKRHTEISTRREKYKTKQKNKSQTNKQKTTNKTNKKGKMTREIDGLSDCICLGVKANRSKLFDFWSLAEPRLSETRNTKGIELKTNKIVGNPSGDYRLNMQFSAQHADTTEHNAKRKGVHTTSLGLVGLVERCLRTLKC